MHIKWPSNTSPKRLLARLAPKGDSQDDLAPNAPLRKRDVAMAAIVCLMLVGVVVGGAVWYLRSHHTGQNTTKPQANARAYTLTPPQGWTKVTPTPEGASVAFALPSADSSGSSRVFIAVQASTLNTQARSASFDTISKSYVSQLGQGYDSFQLMDTRSITIAGLPATLVTFSYTSSMSSQTVQSLFTIKDGISYSVNGESPSEQWQMYSAPVDQSLLTFRP